MKSHVHQKKENRSRANANSDAKRADSRRTSVLKAPANDSSRAGQVAQMQEEVKNSPRMVAQQKQLESAFGVPAQRQVLEEEELLQGKFSPTQRQGNLEEEELLQGKFESVQRQPLEEEELLQGKFPARVTPAQLKAGSDQQANRTGLPDNLKSGLESLSGIDMSDVKVHYNSSKPEQLQAHAYTQGADIHISSGQERHLPHEAWHVAQQKQGRVKPTMQMNGTAINDDPGLEKEADRMGIKALSHR
jgi:hypothetical protein